MLFNSYEFIFIFLPLSFFIYFFLLQKRLIVGAKSFLIFVSLFFYSWWNILYLPLILASILFNYTIGNSLNENFEKVRLHKKSLLVFGIFGNLSLLGYFKYTDFLIENVNMTFDSSLSLLNLALPLAISFFTFQQITYLVDSYRRETREYDFLNYTLFVSFFPQLIAGPIVHHSEMMPQFASRWNMIRNYNNIALGLFIFSIGLFKKVVIADTFSIWANYGFDVKESLNAFEAWVTSLSYTFQLYFDFSGYTDMAIGIALLFNIKLPINFNSPYKALDIQDFWRRWHITLSRFLKDYIYIPLGGNRQGEVRTYTNLLLTFILGGIWHGAGWTFVFWGFLHGAALVIHRAWTKLGFTIPTVLAWFITFNFINIAWIFFRAKEWGDALRILKAMLGINMQYVQKQLAAIAHYPNPLLEYLPIMTLYYVLAMLLLGFIMTLCFRNSNEIKSKFDTMKYVPISWFLFSGVIMGISLVIIGANTNSEFLYFNF